MKLNVWLCTAVLLLTPYVASAVDDDDLVDATNPELLAEIIQDLGYKAKLETDDAGDPIIRSAVAGSQFSILFFGCDENSNDACKMLLFRIGYDYEKALDPDLINAWNEEVLVGRSYLDDEQDPWLEWAVNMDGGVSRKNFEDSFDWWEVSVQDFEEHIEY